MVCKQFPKSFLKNKFKRPPPGTLPNHNTLPEIFDLFIQASQNSQVCNTDTPHCFLLGREVYKLSISKFTGGQELKDLPLSHDCLPF